MSLIELMSMLKECGEIGVYTFKYGELGVYTFNYKWPKTDMDKGL